MFIETVSLYVFLFILGSIMGSFVGALVWRLKHEMDWVKGRSQCEKCQHQLQVIDLIPILSYLALKGRCRYCNQKIRSSTLILEISVATLFVVSAVFLPSAVLGLWINPIMLLHYLTPALSMLLGLWLVIIVLFTGLFVYDMQWKLLPNKLIFPLIGVAFMYSFVLYMFVWGKSPAYWLLNLLLSMLPIKGVYGALYLVSKGRWVGLGDVKLGIAIGAILPWWAGIGALFLANMFSTIIALPGLARRRLSKDSEIALGPHLITATIIMTFFGWLIFNWLFGTHFL